MAWKLEFAGYGFEHRRTSICNFLYILPNFSIRSQSSAISVEVGLTAQMKPIKIWGEGGINPAKVVIIFHELNIPYETHEVLLADVKKPAYTAINPNGRLPTIHDPNTGITLWESGAIIEYLIDKYDADKKLSFPVGTEEFYLAKQWLHFQMSGQGPYYGQASWFVKFHHENVPSAIERYVGEVNRVAGVLDTFLANKAGSSAEHDGPWLVGDKCSYCDLAFIPWKRIITHVLSDEQFSVDKFPHVQGWLKRMGARSAVKAVMDNVKQPK